MGFSCFRIKSVELLSRNCDPNMIQNEHVYAICCRPEVAGDIVSGANVKTVEGYAALNFEAACFSSFRDIKRNHFVTVAAESTAEADIHDSIKRKRIRASLTKV